MRNIAKRFEAQNPGITCAALQSIASTVEYQRLGEALRARGFSQTIAEGEPPYRWTLRGMKLDLMLDPAVSR